MAGTVLRDLGPGELDDPGPRGLLRLATDYDETALTRLVVEDVVKRLARTGREIEVLHAGDVATRIAPVPPAGADQPMLQLWPHLDASDAMFCALLRRRS